MSIRKTVSIATMALAALTAVGAAGWQHEMPPGMSHQEHLAQMKKQAEMKKRGNVAMGFDQDKTTHHFFLTKDGGVIQVEANETSDTTSRDHIRSHLKTISEEFAKGDFHAPLATHNETPPGVRVMRRMKTKIHYSFEERPQGAADHINSDDSSAVKAVHDFLRYQIKEHATGDPLELTKTAS